MAIASIALASLYRSVGPGSPSVQDVQSRVEAPLVAAIKEKRSPVFGGAR